MEKKCILFGLLLILLAFACDEQPQKQLSEPKKATQVYIKSFHYPALSPQAQEEVRRWRSFGNVYKSLLNLTTDELSPPTEPSFLEELFSQDSIYRYKWLYVNGKSKQLTAAQVQRDWQNGELPSDTVYQLIKSKPDAPASLFWNEELLAGVPYIFSFRAKSVMIKNFNFSIERLKDHKVMYNNTFFLDSLQKNEDFQEVSTLEKNWIEVQVPFTPSLTTAYKIAWSLPEQQKKDHYISLYRLAINTHEQYRQQLTAFSQKKASTQEIRSTYTAIYYWAYALEEELKYLYGKNDFPPALDNQAIRSRLKLFESYVRFLKDDVRVNSQLSAVQVKAQVEQIQATFADLLQYINALKEENISEKLQKFESQ